MIFKCLGAALVVGGCAAVGFAMAAAHRGEERSLRQLLSALDYMACELQYRLTPLPDLCRMTAQQCSKPLKQVLHTLSQELESQISPDVDSCMRSALARSAPLPELTRKHLLHLGRTMGRFDLEGQLQGLDGVRESGRNDLKAMNRDAEVRLRGYRTLGICAGVALAILLL